MSTRDRIESCPPAGLPETVRIHRSLPVFGMPYKGGYGVYTPGHVLYVPRRQWADFFAVLNADHAGDSTPLEKTASHVLGLAREAEARWQQVSSTPFRPVRLLVYVSNACNARCAYCFSAHETGRSSGSMMTVSLKAVAAAADYIASNCAAAGLPLELLVHGGGEPSVHMPLVEQIGKETRVIAANHGLRCRLYLATNGILEKSRILRLAELFDEFGLSCDGPPDIQDRQRPARHGPSSPAVENTAAVLHGLGKSFSVRTTITPATCERQVEIVLYLAGELDARHVRLEPVYRQNPPLGFTVEDSGWYARHFMEAQAAAGRLGVRLDTTGVRWDCLRSAYCDVGDSTLHLLPDDSLTACFFAVYSSAPANQTVQIGAFDGSRIVIDHGKLDQLRGRHFTVAARCRDCSAVMHCAGDCPDACRLRDERPDAVPGFRCRTNQILMRHQLLDFLEQITGETPAPPPLEIGAAKVLYKECARLPIALSPFQIPRRLFKAIEAVPFTDHQMPRPVWARRGFEHSGAEAWATLNSRLAEPTGRRISVYVHIPFCRTRCPFCDCHATVPAKNGGDAMAVYVIRLIQEIESWCALPGVSQSPVTTVHFGGGTPNHLPAHCMQSIIDALKRGLLTGPQTEWALETTGRLLDNPCLDLIEQWGFHRIHVGVQTMSDSLRKLIGRKETSETIAGRVSEAVRRGMIVSVDLLYGLPGQHADDLCADIEALDSVGIHGVSLYHLNTSSQNLRFTQRHNLFPRSHEQCLTDYVSFQAAWRRLQSLGYAPSFYNHFSKPEDQYLYYLSGRRGEDLLSVGATSDGRFGDYFYKNHGLAAYVKAASAPLIEGGGCFSCEEKTDEQKAAALMTTAPDPALNSNELPRWRKWGLLTSQDPVTLTPEGAWFISQMIEDAAGRPRTS